LPCNSTLNLVSWQKVNVFTPHYLVRNINSPFTYESTTYKLHTFETIDQITMTEYKKYICVICGFIYDEEEGWPEDGIEPGTRWEDVPENWFCPDCGAGKEDFDMVEID
jgi:rubredoxin